MENGYSSNSIQLEVQMMRIILLAIGSLGTAAGEEYGGEMCGKACKGEVKEEDWEQGVGRKELGSWGIQEKLSLAFFANCNRL